MSGAGRPIDHRYRDPLDLVWLRCAREVGWRVERSEEVFAAYDGAGTLTLSTAEHLDPDDSLAQLIFHELCHALVAGPGACERPDFGMRNTDDRDLLQEHACHRLQAALADRHGLREFFAVTTDHRPYWDGLPLDPLGPSDDPAVPLARAAHERALTGDWAEPLERALSRTASLAHALGDAAPADSLWRRVRALHPRTGFPLSHGERRCEQCAWARRGGKLLRCLQSATPQRRARSVRGEHPACVRFEPRLDAAACGACGACCREGFHRVELGRGERFAQRHPELVARDGFGPHVPRPGGRCVALTGGRGDGPHRCRVYGDRPRACADFEIGGTACLEARRRVGLSA